MTMHHEKHPDDERLAAFADTADAAGADPAIAAHVAACAACRATVDDLRSLRTALADLPDVAPPRALRLVPPVVEPAARTGWASLLRRLTAPAMAVAVILIVVGAVGSAVPFGATATSGGAPDEMMGGAEQQPAAAASAASSARDAYGPQLSSAAATAVPQPVSGGDTGKNLSQEQGGGGQRSGVPYGWFLGTGVVLLAGAFVVRGATAPRSRDPAA